MQLCGQEFRNLIYLLCLILPCPCPLLHSDCCAVAHVIGESYGDDSEDVEVFLPEGHHLLVHDPPPHLHSVQE